MPAKVGAALDLPRPPPGPDIVRLGARCARTDRGPCVVLCLPPPLPSSGALCRFAPDCIAPGGSMADRNNQPKRDPIAVLDDRMARLKREKGDLLNRRRTKARKRHAHCLILIGGALLALAEEDAAAEEVYERAFDRALERHHRDAQALKQWRLERTEQRERAVARAASKRRAESGAGVSAPAAEADNPGGARDAPEVSSSPGDSHPHPNPAPCGSSHDNGGG